MNGKVIWQASDSTLSKELHAIIILFQSPKKWPNTLMVGNPGLVVVMGGDSCSRGHEFEFEHWIPDGLFSY